MAVKTNVTVNNRDFTLKVADGVDVGEWHDRVIALLDRKLSTADAHNGSTESTDYLELIHLILASNFLTMEYVTDNIRNDLTLMEVEFHTELYKAITSGKSMVGAHTFWNALSEKNQDRVPYADIQTIRSKYHNLCNSLRCRDQEMLPERGAVVMKAHESIRQDKEYYRRHGFSRRRLLIEWILNNPSDVMFVLITIATNYTERGHAELDF